MEFFNKDEQRTFDQLATIPKLKMNAESKRRIRQELMNTPLERTRQKRGVVNGFNGVVAGVAGIAVVACVTYYTLSTHNQPSSHQQTTTTSALQAETPYQQNVVNQMTTKQRKGLHEILTRDTTITDYTVYSAGAKGSSSGQLLTQIETDFTAFKKLFPTQMQAIQSQSDKFYEQTDMSTGGTSPGVNGDVLTGDLSEIYLAYQAAIWTMDPTSSVIDKNLVHIVPPYAIPGVFSQYNRLFFGGKIDLNSLTNSTR